MRALIVAEGEGAAGGLGSHHAIFVFTPCAGDRFALGDRYRVAIPG
jgi:hypothetical protein